MSGRVFSNILQQAKHEISSPLMLQRKCACGNHTHGGECADCKKKGETGPGLLQRSAVNTSEVGEVPPIVHEVLRSSGQPLDAATRAYMEPRFGQDFSGVRLHTDSRAAQSARAVNSLAYTVGRDVVFGEGQYAPGASSGKRLLAHELTHVIQQEWGQTSGTQNKSLEVSNPTNDFEREAERHAERTMSGQLGSSVSPVRDGPVRVARTSQQILARQQSKEITQSGAQQFSGLPSLPTTDRLKILSVMVAVQALKSSASANGIYTTVLLGKTISLTQAQRDELIRVAKGTIRDNVRRIRTKAETAKSGYAYQSQIDKEQYIVSSIVKFFGGIKDIGPALNNKVIKAQMKANEAITALEGDNFIQAGAAMAEAEHSATEAQEMWKKYHQGIIGTAETAVTVLEFTRNTSVVIVAAAATGGLGLTGSAALTAGAAVGAGYGAATQFAQQGTEVLLGLRQKIDWKQITFDAVLNFVLSYAGGYIGGAIAKGILGSSQVAASLGRQFVSRIVSNVAVGRGSAMVSSAVHQLYAHYIHGEPLTAKQFVDKLIEQLFSKQAFMDIIYGEIAHHAIGAAAPNKTTPPPEVPNLGEYRARRQASQLEAQQRSSYSTGYYEPSTGTSFEGPLAKQLASMPETSPTPKPVTPQPAVEPTPARVYQFPPEVSAGAKSGKSPSPQISPVSAGVAIRAAISSQEQKRDDGPPARMLFQVQWNGKQGRIGFTSQRRRTAPAKIGVTLSQANSALDETLVETKANFSGDPSKSAAEAVDKMKVRLRKTRDSGGWKQGQSSQLHVWFEFRYGGKNYDRTNAVPRVDVDNEGGHNLRE